MDPKKLAQLVINCISKHNWSDYSVPALALMIERELKNPDIKRKRIERVIESLISSGQLQRTKNEKGNYENYYIKKRRWIKLTGRRKI